MGLDLSFGTISLLLLLLLTSTASADRVFDVRNYGAKSGGDITEAVGNAWKDACAFEGSSTVLIPTTTYRLGTVEFQGPCKGPIEVKVQAEILAPGDPSYFKGDSWVTFKHVDRLTLSGGGTFDGQGKNAWGREGCSKTKYCIYLPVSLKFEFVNNSIIREISSLDSKQFHINVYRCQNVTFKHVTITAPGDSPNTDGIHIGRSTKIKVINSTIGTGDDCVSLGDGSQDILIRGVSCGPGHGISVGSLGKYPNEEPVSRIRVIGCTFNNTMNGVRIKTWPDSFPGSASDLRFENITMNNVDNPVIVDQKYCPWNQCKSQGPSRIKIKDVSFKNIRGTSNLKDAVQIICSRGLPCQNVTIQDIDINYSGGDGVAISRCSNVNPHVFGYKNPPPCTIKT